MEIRFENTITHICLIGITRRMNLFFNTDFDIIIEGEYVFLRDN